MARSGTPGREPRAPRAHLWPLFVRAQSPGRCPERGGWKGGCRGPHGRARGSRPQQRADGGSGDCVRTVCRKKLLAEREPRKRQRGSDRLGGRSRAPATRAVGRPAPRELCGSVPGTSDSGLPRRVFRPAPWLHWRPSLSVYYVLIPGQNGSASAKPALPLLPQGPGTRVPPSLLLTFQLPHL